MGLRATTGVPIRGKQMVRQPRDQGGEGWSDVAASQGTRAASRSWMRTQGCSPRVSGRSHPRCHSEFSALRRILHFWSLRLRRTRLCCSEPVSAGYLLQQPQETHTIPGREQPAPGGVWGPQVAVRVTGAGSQACALLFSQESMWAALMGWGGRVSPSHFVPSCAVWIFYH